MGGTAIGLLAILLTPQHTLLSFRMLVVMTVWIADAFNGRLPPLISRINLFGSVLFANVIGTIMSKSNSRTGSYCFFFYL